MLTLQYALGFGYIGISLALIGTAARPRAVPPATHPAATTVAMTRRPPVDVTSWFTRIKPFCNAVEVETAFTSNPPPDGEAGAGWGAACLALAGKVDRARELIAKLPPGARPTAAGIVFNVAHPVADAGDDRSAGPMMALVAQFWPDNYMALYHAGMSEFALGQADAARDHLTRFARIYSTADGWRSSAVAALTKLGVDDPGAR